MKEGQVLPSENALKYILEIPLDQIQVNCGLRMPSLGPKGSADGE